MPKGVYKHGINIYTKERNLKISKAMKERKRKKGFLNSLETRKKMSLARMGKEPWNKGKKGVYSQEVIEKIRKASKNNKNSLGKHWTMSEQGKINVSLGHRGEKHWNWKDGISGFNYRIRSMFKMRQWRSDVFERDNYTCQECGKRNGFGKTIFLEAHHIKEFYLILKENNIQTIEQADTCEELWNINNGITLCKNCHQKTKKGVPKSEMQRIIDTYKL